MNKRFTTLMTTLILSVFFSISASAYDVEVDGIYYNINKKVKTAEVTYNSDNSYLGVIAIPETITFEDVVYNVISIGEKAFFDCGLLSSITIPNSVTSIGEYAFKNCWSLTSITLSNSLTSIESQVFRGCSSLTSITIPNSVSSLGTEVFRDCSSLTTITIPNSVTNIGYGAFKDCIRLTSIILSNSIKYIETSTFAGCTNLNSITIPNSVISISYEAFNNCSNLNSITIPNSVTEISEHAFKDCSNLHDVYCYAAKVPSTNTDVFKDAYIEYATLYIPESAIDAYKTTEPWSGFGTFKTLEGTEVETKKCETPTISFVEGKLTFTSATEDVEYVSEVKCADVSKFYTNEVSLAACYDISVTAMKTGYDNSDVATAKLYWIPSAGTLEGDNINNVAMRGIAIQSAGGFINISGLDNNEKVSFYGIDGKTLGSAKSIDGNVSFSAKQGTVVVAKIGKESVKIAVE